MLTDRLKGAFLRYLTDSEGRRTAVVVDIDLWKTLIEALEDAEDAQEIKQARDEQDDRIPWEQVVQEYRTEHPDARI